MARPGLGALACVLVVLSTAASPGLCQAPPNVTIGFGVDTSNADVRAIVRTVRDYFRIRGAGHARTTLWSAAEQRARHDYDLTADFVFQGFDATIASVTSARADDAEYVVRTLFAHADSNGANIRPVALQRLYATRRADGAWELSSALPRLTAGWVLRDVKYITYHMPDTWRFDQARADQAVRFLDSAAHALQVPRPEHIDYYLTTSAEEMYRILGLDYFVLPSGPLGRRGGKSFPHDGIVISGDPDMGEAYFHELAHVVIGVAYPEGARSTLLNEGFATWLGGSRGRPYGEMVQLLFRYEQAHPRVRLVGLLSGDPGLAWDADETDALYASGALIFDVVNTHYGVWGIKKLLGLRGRPNRAVEPDLRELLQIWQNLDDWWRTETQRAADRYRRAGAGAPAVPSGGR